MSITSTTTKVRATFDDLMNAPGKAELIGGEIVHLMGTGFRPSLIAANIYRSLFAHISTTGRGFAFTDNLIYGVPELSSGRESFSPDASYYLGAPPSDEMDVVPGPPTLAIEVRSKSDYGPAAEAAMAAKRADYFEAGTPIVWDVDPRDKVVRAYRADAPDLPVVFGSSQEADAEPVIPDWRIAVDSIFA
jgi:Uma2 family endonuclease